MKKHAQIVTSLIFVSIVIKGFFGNLSFTDSTILILSCLVYCMYEVMLNTKERKELEEYKKETQKKIQQLEEDIQNAKNYMSKIVTTQSIRR